VLQLLTLTYVYDDVTYVYDDVTRTNTQHQETQGCYSCSQSEV